MRVVTNKKLAKRNRQITQYMFFGTFGVLILGFIFINSTVFTNKAPDTLAILLQTAVLPIAFIFTIISVRMTNLWARVPRPENAIEEGLKGLSNKSVLYNYYHFPARHVLICPQGIYAIVTRWHDQEYTVEDGKFRSHRNAISRFLSAFIRFDSVGDPFEDARRAQNKVAQLLSSIAPDVEVKPLIVFVDPKAVLNIKDTSIPVLHADTKLKPNLKSFLRDAKRDLDKESGTTTNAQLMPLTDEQIEEFEQRSIKK